MCATRRVAKNHKTFVYVWQKTFAQNLKQVVLSLFEN